MTNSGGLRKVMMEHEQRKKPRLALIRLFVLMLPSVQVLHSRWSESTMWGIRRSPYNHAVVVLGQDVIVVDLDQPGTTDLAGSLVEVNHPGRDALLCNEVPNLV